MKSKSQLSKQAHECLVEALRRFTRFSIHDKKYNDIRSAWTGLGSITEYKSAWKDGFMEPVEFPMKSAPRKGVTHWWRLTTKGAALVKYWYISGYTFRGIDIWERCERHNLPITLVNESDMIPSPHVPGFIIDEPESALLAYVEVPLNFIQ